MFEHNILASVLALISKICALILCYVSHRKCLPLMVLQFFTAICYFLLSSVDFDPKDSSHFGIGVTFVVHMSTFLITASFGLVWVITPETFPKKYRYITWLQLKEYETEPKSNESPKSKILICRYLRIVLLHLCTKISFNLYFRSTCTGICSGAARLGAITGIIIGEYGNMGCQVYKKGITKLDVFFD